MAKNNTQFNRINIETPDKTKTKLPWSRNFFTTSSFGECVPLQVKKILAHSKTVCGTDQLLRLSPMVLPTYGDVKLKIWHNFVGMSDLIRSYTKFVTGQPYSTTQGVRTQTYKPRMKLSDISSLILIGCKFTIYDYDTINGTELTPDARATNWRLYETNDSVDNLYRKAEIVTQLLSQGYLGSVTYEDARFPSYRGIMVSPRMFNENAPTNLVPCANQNIVAGSQDPDTQVWTANPDCDLFGTTYADDGVIKSAEVPLNKADFVFTRNIGTEQNPSFVAFAVRLSSFGTRLYKILKACGFEVNFADNESYLDILPLFAYYKTYFDSFGLCLYQNYESTNAAYLLNQYDNANSTVFDLGNTEFMRFIYDLGNTYVADVQDFISAHQRTDAVSTNSEGFIKNIVLDPNYNGQDLTDNISQFPNPQSEYPNVTMVTNHVFIDKVNHSEVSAELLKRLYKFTNRNTIAGRRIAELLRAAGYGAYVDEQKSSFIGYSEVQVSVSDINATADSYNTPDQKGSILGEYVGKGIGYNEKVSQKKFVYENEEVGYWITMVAVVPSAGYTQSLDPLLYCTEREEEYQREMDGLGQEFTRKNVLVGGPSWYHRNAFNDKNAFRDSFGLVPRETRYKVAHQLVSGDFALRSTRDGYLPFSVDKFIDVGNREVVQKYPEQPLPNMRFFTARTNFNMTDVPIAGNTWRFNARYPWLNNFNRIFASMPDEVAQRLDLGDEGSLIMYELTHRVYDGFILLGRFDMDAFSPVLAIADSYGTMDEDGKSNTSMTKA